MTKVWLSIVMIIAIAKGATTKTLKETLKETIPVTSEMRLVVKNQNGDVIIEGWDRSEVYIEATKVGKGRYGDKLRKDFSRVQVQINQESKELIVKTLYPSVAHQFSFWNWLKGTATRIWVNYHIKVPRSMVVRVKGTNGDVEAKGVKSNLLLRTTNGDITVVDCNGIVKAKTTNGDIEVELVEVIPGDEYELETTNGDVEAELPAGYGYSFHARTTNGSVENAFLKHIRNIEEFKQLEAPNKPHAIFWAVTTNGDIVFHKRNYSKARVVPEAHIP